MISRRIAGLLAVLASALGVASWAAAAAAPVFWPTAYAQKQVYDHYASYGADVACAGVGPIARQHGVQYFGEFACDVASDSGELVLAVVPTSSIHWKTLEPGDPSPVAGPVQGIAAAGSARKVAEVDATGHAVMLDDQSTWKVVDKLGRLASWQPGDTVMIEADPAKAHFYTVVNKGRGDDLEADFRGFS